MRLSRAPCGFTLIEVMITMFVIAVGLLSSAALQAMSKKVNFDAVQRTTATTLAQAMIERMRGNPGQLVSYLTVDASSATIGTDCSASGAKCSATDLPTFDLAMWAQSMQGTEAVADSQNAGGLVDPTGCIFKGTGDGLYIVAVAWRGITGLAPADAGDPVDDPARNTCGQGLGRYDDPASAGADDRMRRIVVIGTYIADPYAS